MFLTFYFNLFPFGKKKLSREKSLGPIFPGQGLLPQAGNTSQGIDAYSPKHFSRDGGRWVGSCNIICIGREKGHSGMLNVIWVCERLK